MTCSLRELLPLPQMPICAATIAAATSSGLAVALTVPAAIPRRSAALFAGAAAQTTVVVKEFRDGFFPYAGAEIKDFFEALKREVVPDIIFTHYRGDQHQDHRLVSELTWNTFRDHLILEYEVPKYDGDLGRPNWYVPLDERTCRTKTRNLLDAFASQRDRRWFSEETFRALMRLRGVECAAPEGYAEAFYAHKVSWVT